MQEIVQAGQSARLVLCQSKNGTFAYAQGYNSVNLSYYTVLLMQLFGLAPPDMGPRTWGSLCRMTKVDLAAFDITSPATLDSFTKAISWPSGPQEFIVESVPGPWAKHVQAVTWPWAILALCEVTACIRFVQQQCAKRNLSELSESEDFSCAFLVELATRWAASSHCQPGVEVCADVTSGASSAVQSLTTAMERLSFPVSGFRWEKRCSQPCSRQAAAQCMINAGLVAKTFWPCAPDVRAAASVFAVWMKLGCIRLRGCHLAIFNCCDTTCPGASMRRNGTGSSLLTSCYHLANPASWKRLKIQKSGAVPEENLSREPSQKRLVDMRPTKTMSKTQIPLFA